MKLIDLEKMDEFLKQIEEKKNVIAKERDVLQKIYKDYLIIVTML